MLFFFLSHAKPPAASAVIGSSLNHSIETSYKGTQIKIFTILTFTQLSLQQHSQCGEHCKLFGNVKYLQMAIVKVLIVTSVARNLIDHVCTLMCNHIVLAKTPKSSTCMYRSLCKTWDGHLRNKFLFGCFSETSVN